MFRKPGSVVKKELKAKVMSLLSSESPKCQVCENTNDLHVVCVDFTVIEIKEKLFRRILKDPVLAGSCQILCEKHAKEIWLAKAYVRMDLKEEGGLTDEAYLRRWGNY